MAAVTLSSDDVLVFLPDADTAQVDALVTGALARAALVAPCILEADFDYEDAARGIIIDAILRRMETGAGALSMQQAGPFQQAMDTRTSPRELYWPGEIVELQRLCATASTSGGALPSGNFPTTADWPDAVEG